MSKQINKQVFLDELPRITYYSEDKIDWKNCNGKMVNFIYGNIEDTFEIISHNIGTQRVEIKYNNETFFVKPNSIINGKLGQLFKKKRSTYLYDIGDTIIDNNRNLLITSKYKNSQNIRWYKYTCNICGWTEGEQSEYQLERGVNCSCCSNRTVVKGINDITTTAPWMVKYFQGGEEEASKYTCCSGMSITPICPDCKTIAYRSIRISDLYNKGYSCGICNDGYSYPEKFMYSILKQLNIKFITQFSKKEAKWCKKYRYDFYLPDYNCIIETHGMQHYQYSGFKLRSLEEEMKNDENKKTLAELNGCQYYVIDCRKSTKNWIKQSTIDSGILNYLGCSFENINWDECDTFAISNRCKEACNLKAKYPEMTATDISKMMKISPPIIGKYLHIGTELGWCYYNKNGNKRIMMSKDNIEICVFNSVKEITKVEEYKDFCETTIQNVCRGHIDSYKGYKFSYI